jgi:hypothetical protein
MRSTVLKIVHIFSPGRYDHAEIKSPEPIAIGTTRALVGKIARLPKDIREEFNRRLDNGEPGSVILSWVNGLPAAKTILDKHFGGVPISDANLSQWRQKKGHARPFPL